MGAFQSERDFKIGFQSELALVCSAVHLYLLLAECEVRTEVMDARFFLSVYGPSSAKRAGHENKGGTNEDP